MIFGLCVQTMNMNKDTEKNHSKIKLAVLIPARNEEKIIANTLSNLLEQDLKPYRIIVINDGSTDETGKIISGFKNVELIDREKRNVSFLGRKELAETVNVGLRNLHADKDCQFVMITGADLLFPKNYLANIIERMKENPKIAVASGVVENEFSIEPRGPGRVIRCDFWRKLDFLYPVNYGWEGYLLLKAQSMGYDVISYPDIIVKTQRKTGTRFDPKRYYYYGIALKALGYTFLYTIMKILLFSKQKPRGAYFMLKGYLSNYDELYEHELREYVKKTQHQNMFKPAYVKRFFKMLKSK